MRHAARIGVTCYVMAISSVAYGDIFSTDRYSPSWGDPGDLLSPGPTLHVLRANLGLIPLDDLDAVTQGLDSVRANDILYFSVDRTSMGVPGSPVRQLWGVRDVASNIFATTTLMGGGVYSPPIGAHALDVPRERFGLPNGDVDNLDAYSMEEFDYSRPPDLWQDVAVYLSIDRLSPSTAQFSPADILMAPPNSNQLQVWFSAATMGLGAGDDIDALAVLVGPGGGPRAYFSLAPGSPSGAPADIFFTTFNGSSELLYPAGSLGLLATDNVDALETNPVPEPAGLVALLMAGALCLRRRSL